MCGPGWSHGHLGWGLDLLRSCPAQEVGESLQRRKGAWGWVEPCKRGIWAPQQLVSRTPRNKKQDGSHHKGKVVRKDVKSRGAVEKMLSTPLLELPKLPHTPTKAL